MYLTSSGLSIHVPTTDVNMVDLELFKTKKATLYRQCRFPIIG